MDDVIGGGVVTLLCFIVMVMVVCIWFFLCYCTCRTKRDYKQTKKHMDDLASRSFRQHLYHHQQSRELDYSRLTNNHQELRPQTPRLDHPRFQRTFLSDLARSPSMEFQSSLSNQRAPLTTSTPIQGSMVSSLHSVGSGIPNVTPNSRPLQSQHFTLSEQLSTNSHQPSHGFSRSHSRYQSDSNIRDHPSTQHQTHLQQSNSTPQRSMSPTSRQSSRPPRIVLGTPNSDRLQSVREFEEMDVQAEQPEDPPRYSILFPSNYRGENKAYKGPMPFSFGSPPPGSRSQGWRQPPVSELGSQGWRRPPPTRTEFSQLSSWPQHLT